MSTGLGRVVANILLDWVTYFGRIVETADPSAVILLAPAVISDFSCNCRSTEECLIYLNMMCSLILSVNPCLIISIENTFDYAAQDAPNTPSNYSTTNLGYLIYPVSDFENYIKGINPEGML